MNVKRAFKTAAWCGGSVRDAGINFFDRWGAAKLARATYFTSGGSMEKTGQVFNNVDAKIAARKAAHRAVKP